jgi:hypothetical protein
VITEAKFVARLPCALFPSPLEGEGARAEAKPSEGGRGVLPLFSQTPLSRLALRYRYRASHPLPQGERGSEFALRGLP